MDVRQQLGLRKVINVCGVPSLFGAGSACSEVIEAAAGVLPLAVDMIDVQRAASREIALATGAEAGCVTGCAAAAIAVTVAATITGRDLARVRDLPRRPGSRRRVVVQSGHDFSCGAPGHLFVEIPGADLYPVGTATCCTGEQLAEAMGPDVCAGLFIMSQGNEHTSFLGLTQFADICHNNGIPVIADAAANLDLREPFMAGADLAIFSAQKILGGLTAGIIAGRRELVGACFLQERGIGRAMKAGKEAVVGTMVALKRWREMDHNALREEWQGKLTAAVTALGDLRGVTVTIEDEPYDRGFKRLRLDVEPRKTGINAWELVATLRVKDPAIVLWPYDVDKGRVYLDARCSTLTDVLLACRMIRQVIDEAPQAAERTSPPALGHDAFDQEFVDWP